MFSLHVTIYEWLNPLNNKKGKIVLNALVKTVNESNRKSNKLWVDQERKLYDKLMHEWLDNKDI